MTGRPRRTSRPPARGGCLRSPRSAHLQFGEGGVAVGIPDATPFGGHVGPVFCVAFSPDSSTLATGGEDGIVRLWDTVTGQQTCLLRHGGSPTLSPLSAVPRAMCRRQNGQFWLTPTAYSPPGCGTCRRHSGSGCPGPLWFGHGAKTEMLRAVHDVFAEFYDDRLAGALDRMPAERALLGLQASAST